MNKLLTIAAALLGATSLSFSQGIVDFENFKNSLIYTNSVHGGPATGLMYGPGGTYRFAILAAEPTTATIDATLDNGTALDAGGWVFEDDTGTNTATPGLMNGNYTTDPGIDIIGWGPGEAASFAVVGWSTNIGTTYADAKAWWNNGNPNSGPSGYFTISSVAQDVLVGGSVYPVPTIFGPTPGYEVQGFTLNFYVANVFTLPATAISATSATLNGSVLPGGVSSTAWFEWGQTTSCGNTTTVVDIGSGTSSVPVSAVLSGLSQGFWYHFRVVRHTGSETNYGPDVAFGTSPATFIVTSLADNGPGTLRYLLSIAASDDTINFTPGLTGTLTVSGPLAIVRNIAIIGSGTTNLTISGNNACQIFVTSLGATSSLSGLTISSGFESGFPTGGAGIANGGNLTVSNCIFTGNSEQGWGPRGGAILNTGTLRLIGCAFSGNSLTGSIGSSGVNATGTYSPAGDGTPGSTAAGGAIYNSGAMTALKCTFSGNNAQGGAGGNGGSGGSYGPGGKGGNGGSGLGGAIETSGSCTLINCTIANNTTTLGNGGTGGSQVGPPTQALNGTNGTALGGGIHMSPGGTVTIWNTLVAGNTGSSPDVGGTFTSQGHNLIGATNGSSGWTGTDQHGVIGTPLNPSLGPLQNNSGPTPTLALLPGSVAIDAGDDSVMNAPTSLTTDQRGQPRDKGAHVDIGAYEYGPLFLMVSDLHDHGPGTLRDLVSASQSGDTLSFAVNGDIVLTNGEVAIGNNITIIGLGATNLMVSGNNSNRVFNIASGVTAGISGLTIANGRNAGAPGSDGQGGGIFTLGNLNLTNCILRGNVAGGGAASCPACPGWGAAGGAIYNGGHLWLYGCTFQTNAAIGAQGADGIFSSNPFDGGNGGFAAGGAVYNAGRVDTVNCTFWGNTVNGGFGGDGAAVYPPANGGNGGDGTGGAIENLGILTLYDCTVSSNTAVGGFGGAGAVVADGDGGFIYGNDGALGQTLGGGVYTFTNVAGFINTIIAANSGGGSPDVSGTILIAGYNLIGATNGSSGWLASNLMGSTNAPLNPLLGPLQDNGGPTPTMALLTGSPAIDAGDDVVLTSSPFVIFDQRGQSRQIGAHVDIGAYEAPLPPPTLSVVLSGANVILSWPSQSTGFVLQQNSNLANPNGWSPCGDTPGDNGTIKSILISPPTGNLFFRLMK